MEKSKHIIAGLLMLFCFNAANASYKSEIYKAYIYNNMEGWRVLLDTMNANRKMTNEFRLELVSYQYGYIAWCIGRKRNDEAEKYLDIGEKHIEVLKKNNYNPSMINAYKAAFYGYRIGLNILKATYLGPESVSCAKKSIKLNPSNPYGYIQYGHIQYYMPPIFGGSKAEALSYYLKSKGLMEKNAIYTKENWNYINLLTFIAQTYIVLGKNNEAKAAYENILKIEPDFVWVKKRLYPELLKKMNEAAMIK